MNTSFTKALLLFTAVLLSGFPIPQTDPTSTITNNPAPPQTTSPAPTSDWLAAAHAAIAAQEYHIQWQADRCAYSSPNRRNNLRITYREDGFSLRPRMDSLENWNLSYTIQGIYREEENKIGIGSSPTMTVSDHELRQDFSNGLQIQYLNTAQGMRQNFLVAEKPTGTGPLKVRLKTEGSLFPVKKGNGDVVFAEKNPLTGALTNRVWYKDLKVLDARGHAIPATMEVSTPTPSPTDAWLATIDLQVDDAHATYPLLIDPLSTTAATTVENNQNQLRLGDGVASAGDVNGDGYSDVVVTAPNYDNGQSDEGAAYIYHGSPTGISTTYTTLVESNAPIAGFGWSIGTAGDVNGDGYSDLVSGAYLYDNVQVDEGAFYLYYGSAAGLNTTATVIESNQTGAQFGSSVATAGDVNGDGYTDIIAGANRFDNGQTNEGVAFVYHGGPAGLNPVPVATLEANQASAEVGQSVACAGDVNGDGYSDVIVGARSYSNGQLTEGAAFVYLGTATGINTSTSTLLEINQVEAELGQSVASAGDVNGDGYSDVIVGAHLYDNGQTSEGAAFIFHGSATGILPAVAATMECNLDDAFMGTSVASAGDVNGDGYSDVIVGAPEYADGESAEGGAFFYYGGPAGIITSVPLIYESDQDDAFMGRSVASAGDVNGDGYSDIVIGVPLYDNGQLNEGVAYVYHGGTMGIDTSAVWMGEGNQVDANFGISVASVGDVNGDGYSDVIVGAPYYDDSLVNNGAVFIYHGSATGLNPAFNLMIKGLQQAEGFGLSVSSAGDVNGDGYSDVIIGTEKFDRDQAAEGAAFVYYGSATGIILAGVDRMEGNQIQAYFGRAVATAGDVNGDGYSDVIVGSKFYDNGQTSEGAAFVYHGGASGIDTSFADRMEGNQVDGSLGNAVAAAGDVNGDGYSDVIVGASSYSNGQTDEGVAFIYLGSATGIDTTVATMLECNQATAFMGYSVAAAGDVNADGFSDVIVGAKMYENGQPDEGASFVYHGSASGVDVFPEAVIEGNQAASEMAMGAGAGDVNGDGYSDIVVGAQFFTNAPFPEGAAFIYHGSPAGIGLTAAAMVESNQANSSFGISVASAGDVNGDGYSDVIVGALYYDVGQSNEGAAFVYYGNHGPGLRTAVRQFEFGTNVTVGPGGFTGSTGQVRLSMTGKSFLGRQQGKMAWEYAVDGVPFSSAGGFVTNSVAASGVAAAFAGLTGTGTVLVEDLSGFTVPLEYKWRSRIRYDAVTAITGQVYGPWYYHKSRTPEVPMLGFKPIVTCATPVAGSLSADTLLCGYHVSCPGVNDGVAHVVGSGGCPSYTYLWSTGDTSANVAGLAAGTYTVTITDAAGGSYVDSIVLLAPAPMLVAAVAVGTCVGDSTGSIDLTVAGGNDCLGYTYAWSNGAVAADMSGLVAGSYTVTVTDAGGCTAIFTTAVPAFPVPNPSFVQSGNTLTATQPWVGYQWLLNGSSIPGANGISYGITQTGVYSLLVTDSNGCTGVSDTSTVVGMVAQLGDLLGLVVYPNPVRDVLMLGSAMPIRYGMVVRMYDVFGHCWVRRELVGLEYGEEFDVRGFAAGVYVVEVGTEHGERRVWRVVVE